MRRNGERERKSLFECLAKCYLATSVAFQYFFCRFVYDEGSLSNFLDKQRVRRVGEHRNLSLIARNARVPVRRFLLFKCLDNVVDNWDVQVRPKRRTTQRICIYLRYDVPETYWVRRTVFSVDIHWRKTQCESLNDRHISSRLSPPVIRMDPFPNDTKAFSLNEHR